MGYKSMTTRFGEWFGLVMLVLALLGVAAILIDYEDRR